jgi:hypothetical protein
MSVAETGVATASVKHSMSVKLFVSGFIVNLLICIPLLSWHLHP